MDKGSTWRKWDLHVHSPASFQHQFGFADGEDKQKYQDDIWEKYVDELEKVSGISVIGITDYFCIDGYKKAFQYRKRGKLQNFDLILPNIEFRLDKFVADRRLNYHIILSNEIEVDKIEKEFLEELPVKTPDGEERKLTREHIEEIGKTLKEHEESFRDRSDYTVGCENITVSLDKIVEVLKAKKSIFAGKYLLVLAEEGWDSISWAGQDHLTRKRILRQSQAIFSSNPSTRDWALGKKDLSPNDFEKEFDSLKSCIHGSDAHSFERLCKPDLDRFCWIKADPTFEGLKQIVYEPEERVRIQPENPEPRKNIYTFDSIRITNSQISHELSIEEQDISLNRNLIAVTGGKGSGKTALLDLIANCFEDRCKRAAEDKNSFVQRIEEQKQDLEVEIAFIGGDVEEFSKKLMEEKFFRDSRITYLPQGKIEEYSGDREKLDKKITEIIFSNKDVIAGGYSEKFNRLRDEIVLLNKKIDEINTEIYKFEEATKKEVISDITTKKAIKDGELKDREDELSKLTETMDEGIKERVAKLKEEDTRLRVINSKFEGLKIKLEQFKGDLERFSDDSNNTIDDLNRDFSELMLNLTIPRLDFKCQLDVINEAHEVVRQKIVDVTSQLDERRKELTQLSGVERTHAELLENIESIKTEIKSLGKQLQELDKKRENTESLESARREKYHNLLGKYFEWKNYYDEVIKVFSRGKSKIMGEIDFESSIYFDKDKFVELGSDILDQRRINVGEIEEYAEKLGTMISENNHEMLANKIEGFIQEIFTNKALLKETRTNYDFYKWVFGDYFSLSTKVLFRGRAMDKLSIGQKGTVLLELFLAEGDYPLIVDQPEESLDNKFIYDELVEALREAKKKRQVIIATNNANLVVNTDTEQIIVAEFENNRICYCSGSLENLEMRKHIIPILEGGEKAFKKREEKYGI